MGRRRTMRRQSRQADGFTVIEAMLSLAVLEISVLAVTFALQAGQAHGEELDNAMRAVELGEDIMEEILAKPYDDPDGVSGLGPESGETPRSGFDNADDFHDYAESPGSVTDQAGNLYEPAAQVFSRTVSMTATSESVSGLGTLSGLNVSVDVQLDGRTWNLTRFIAEDAP